MTEKGLDDRLLGARDPDVREPESLAAILGKARALGFSEAELVRLRSYFEGRAGERLGEHRAGGAGD